jgi:hypothetical protein
VLEAARAEIDKAVARVDKADATHLAALAGAAHQLAAFVDFNSGCGKPAFTGGELMTKLRG